MRVPGLKRLRAASRWGRSRLRSRALILGYHRIAGPGNGPSNMCVSPEDFRRHLQELRKVAKPVRLSDLVVDLGEGRVKAGSVALTFDDAYLETLEVAEPILAEYDIPATVFVVTSTLGEELWWDRLHRIGWTAGSLPERLHICEGSSALQWERDPGVARGSGSGKGEQRERIFKRLYRALLRASKEDREAALKRLQEWTGAGAEVSPSSRVVSERELKRLADSALIEIGSHSVSHPMLAGLSREEQEREVGPSRVFLQELLGRDVNLFSYPNGSFDEASEELVREAGFTGACTSRRDVVVTGTGRYRLPRFWPSDSPRALSGLLRVWLGR